jgi:gamma-glutamylcyclotransferase (GGCT)/AIG2-like uncharacterized protein YtfP
MNNDTLTYLFVYGSLRQGFHNAAYSYISQYFSLVASGTVIGHLYDLGSYPAAKPAAADGPRLVGELYRINNPLEFEWAIAQIDDYEGVHTEPHETPLYYRDKAMVQLADGTSTEAWIYWYKRDVQNAPVIASGDVLQYLQSKK